ncbi:hypothetical protein L195_g023112 [Trifolium pratense]|uniref:Calmodulin-binding protein n=1 Tax=Trifolium pratense TaxID=57577 RepID=A0A2K3N4Y1_TRIPR|nr:hypothetical protein L195_g021322 [Trifolium pratense]PNX98737.1 hypothetical protein L195_g021994 [Trifolium pratense]PNX99842.1 hypothetical protein L195_g023112 [Trifolium pratense]
MEVMAPVAAAPFSVDFNFDSNSSSPYITAPSSPQRFANNFFFSAPTSPSRVSPLFPAQSSHPEPNHSHNNNYSLGNDDDFAFDFSGNLQRDSLSAADELFHGGKIRPLKPPQRFHSGDIPISPITQKKNTVYDDDHDHERDLDQFEAAIEEKLRYKEEKRGRERNLSSGRKGSRSLSPLRVSDIVENSEDVSVSVSSSTSNMKSFLSFTKGYRKWRIRDFLLFRSASEGRANEKDPLRKYTALSKKSAAAAEDDVRNSSFRSTEGSGSFSRRRGPVSAHELHYTLNRAATEELKKKTFLPYKRGLLGCLGSNHHRMDQISRGIGSLPRS